MNSYKVTYLLNGEEHYGHITERTEKAAQKRLKSTYKDAEITDTIEIVPTPRPRRSRNGRPWSRSRR